MSRFQGEEYGNPSSLHTNRKVAQKDPIFPPKVNSNVTLHTTTRCKRNINISNTRTHILIFLHKTNLPFDLLLERGEE